MVHRRAPLLLCLFALQVACASPRQATTLGARPRPATLSRAPALGHVGGAIATDVKPFAAPEAAAPWRSSPPSECALHASRLDRWTPWPAGHVVLTFDDGPHPRHTPRVLKALQKRGLPGAFFVLGRHIRRDTYHLLQRMEAADHVIASHSYNHDTRMASHRADDAATMAYIRGQHEVTRFLIELALLATSEEDFDAMYVTVFRTNPQRWLTADELREQWPQYQRRHHELRAKRGYPDGRYAVRYTRPPGGGPYLERHSPLQARFDRALGDARLFNVLWHAESGDVHPSRRRELSFLHQNIRRAARRGGVLLMHDHIAAGALSNALDELARAFTVEGLDEATRRTFHCPANSSPPQLSPRPLG